MENNQITSPVKHGKKSFYIGLCALLGILLFVVLQRSLFLIYLLLLNNDFSKFNFSLSPEQFAKIDFITLSLAVIFGFWYGIWLGLHWYHYVYEQNHQGLFYGLKGRSLSTDKPAHAFPANPKAVKPSIEVKSNVFSSPAPQVSKNIASPIRPDHWDLDDLAATKTSIIKKTRSIKPRVKTSAENVKLEPLVENSFLSEKDSVIAKKKVVRKVVTKKRVLTPKKRTIKKSVTITES